MKNLLSEPLMNADCTDCADSVRQKKTDTVYGTEPMTVRHCTVLSVHCECELRVKFSVRFDNFSKVVKS